MGGALGEFEPGSSIATSGAGLDFGDCICDGDCNRALAACTNPLVRLETLNEGPGMPGPGDDERDPALKGVNDTDTLLDDVEPASADLSDDLDAFGPNGLGGIFDG